MKFFTENIWLVGLALGSGGMLLWSWLRRLMPGNGEISPAEAVTLINHAEAQVIDVRDPAEFAAGHIAAARNIPLAQLGGRLAELEAWKQKPLIVNCQAGKRSASASALLRGQGYVRVFNLGGGIDAWKAANLPVSKD